MSQHLLGHVVLHPFEALLESTLPNHVSHNVGYALNTERFLHLNATTLDGSKSCLVLKGFTFPATVMSAIPLHALVNKRRVTPGS